MTPADLLPKLQQHLTSLGDGRDCRSDNEKAAWWSACTDTQRTISGLLNLPADLARAEAKLTEAEAPRDAWLAKQDELTAQIAAFTDWRLAGDARARDTEYDRQRDLTRQLQRLHQGTLFAGPGLTFGSLAPLEARVAELTARRDRAKQQLDALLTQAEALLGELVTTTP